MTSMHRPGLHAISEAIAECDSAGTDEFLLRYGYKQPTKWQLLANGRHYPPRAIYARAAKLEAGLQGALAPEEGPRALSEAQLREIFEPHGHEVVQAGPDDSSRYWAFAANPDIYRVDDAVRELVEDTWGVKEKGVRAGDRCLIWRFKGSRGRRGIIALGEVLTDPSSSSDAHNPYWIKSDAGAAQANRVRIRYQTPSGLPLWLDEHPDLLTDLAVARASGGSIFRVTTEQWESIWGKLRGGSLEESSEATQPTASAEDLEARASSLRRRGPVPRPLGNANPERAESTSAAAFQRDPSVVAWVLQQADGECELCGKPAAFRRRSDGTPYLEVHHPHTLAEGGPDVVENAVALCPACHRELHHGVERDVRLRELRRRVIRLRD